MCELGFLFLAKQRQSCLGGLADAVGCSREGIWGTDPGLLEVAGTWGQVGVLAASAVGCAGAMGILEPPEGREVTSGRVAGGAVSDLCYKEAGYAQLGVYPLLAQRPLYVRQHQVFGG